MPFLPFSTMPSHPYNPAELYSPTPLTHSSHPPHPCAHPRGMYQVIQPDLLSIFCAPELQVLISGANSGISVDDLKRHTQYAGGYTMVDRHVARFWAVMDELTPADRSLVVKFVTSC